MEFKSPPLFAAGVLLGVCTFIQSVQLIANGNNSGWLWIAASVYVFVRAMQASVVFVRKNKKK